MRLIGIILIVAGLYFAIAKPWFSTNLTGEELVVTQVYNKNNTSSENRGWEVSSVFLEKENSPAIVRIKVSRLPVPFNSSAILKLLVRVAPVSQDGTTNPPIVNEAVTVNLDTGTPDTRPGQKPVVTVISTKPFSVPATGNYKIGAFPIAHDNVTKGNRKLQIDANITGISATVMSDVEPVTISGTVFGGALIVVGLLLMSVFKRRRKYGGQTQPERVAANVDEEPEPIRKPVKEVVEPEAEKAPPKTEVGKTIQWGRDAGKKR